MKTKHLRQLAIYLLLLLIVASVVFSELIFIRKNQQRPFTIDSTKSPAKLSFSGGGSKTMGADFNLSALISSGDNRVCVVDFTITYPADLLELKSSSLATPFSMATIQESSAGKIHNQIGATGCSSVDSTIFNMTFSAKAVGNAPVVFSSSDILGGDDGSRAIMVTREKTTINIASQATPE